MRGITSALIAAWIVTGITQRGNGQVKIRPTAILAMDADGTNVRELATIPDFPIINSPEISPDGKYVAVDGWKAGESLRDAQILIVNLDDGSVIRFCRGAMPSWSADGRQIAFCKYSPERGVYVRALDDSVPERLIDPDGWGIQWSPDGTKVAYTRGGKFVIYDFAADTREEILPSPKWDYSTIYWNCKWSGDSNSICFLARRRNGKREIGILRISAADRQLRVRTVGPEFNPDIAWHPDGSRIMIPRASRSGEPGQIYVFDADRFDMPTRLPGQPPDRQNGGMCWSRDGKTLVFLSQG